MSIVVERGVSGNEEKGSEVSGSGSESGNDYG